MESRQVAVRGFLQFLRNFRLLGTLPSSQASMSFSSSLSTSVSADVHTVFNSSTNEALCLELLGILRRCFSQQHEIKSTFYLGLHDVCRANPKLAISILEMLHQHIKGFLDLRKDILNPVVLKKAIVVRGDNVVLVEPMWDTLSSLASCKTYYEKMRDANDDDDEIEVDIEVLNEVCTIFDVLTERLSGCDLEDLGINTNGDFSNNSQPGQKNLLSCQVMVGVFDSLIEHTFINGAQDSEEKMHTMISLFKSQKKLTDLVKEKSTKPAKNGEGSKGKGRSSTKSSVTFKSHLSSHAAADMLAASLGSNSEEGSILKSNPDFQMYLLSTVEEIISSVKGSSKSEKEKILPQLKTITKVLLQECVEKLGGADSSDEREVVRLRHSLHILHSLMIIFSKFYKDKLESVMKEILGKTDNKNVDTLLYKFSKRCQKMLLRILHHEESTPLLKDASVVVNIMTTATQVMNPECSEIEDIQDWINQLCKDQDPDNSELAKALMTLLIKLSNQIKVNHNLTRGLARELHHKLGDFEQGVEVEEINKYKIVTENTASAILTSVLAHLDDTLGLIELVLNKMKACVTTSTEFEANEVEKCISVKCSIVMVSVNEVIHSALPDGATIDQTLRVVTKLYNVLSLYVKYYLDLYRLKNNTQISDKFEKVVQNSAEMVSKPVYPMITYIESTQRQIGNKKQSSLTARAIKESKLIPSMIFSLEQYEKHLITLSRKSKVNLMQAMKLSTARDFRIMPNALNEFLAKENGEEEEQENNNAEGNGNGVDDANHASDQESDDDNDDSRQEEPPRPQPKATKKRKSQRDEEEGKEGNENNPNTQNTEQPASKKTKKTPQRKLGRKV